MNNIPLPPATLRSTILLLVALALAILLAACRDQPVLEVELNAPVEQRPRSLGLSALE